MMDKNETVRFKYNGQVTDYGVTRAGDVWSFKNKKPLKLKPIKNAYGYLVVNVYLENAIRQFRIHRLVATTFIPNDHPDTHIDVNHKDGNKTNNDIDNLEWCTPKYNTEHAIKTGLRINSGEDFHSSVLTEKEVIRICELLVENKLKAKDIAKEIGEHCSVAMVRNIYYRLSWVHVGYQYPLERHTVDQPHGPSKLTYDQVHLICRLLQSTFLSYRKIAKLVGGCTHREVNHIKNRYTWTSISKDYDFSGREKRFIKHE